MSAQPLARNELYGCGRPLGSALLAGHDSYIAPTALLILKPYPRPR